EPRDTERAEALAEKCEGLEQELVETRSLLTSLGEELLQAREAAAKQVSALNLRIDELEGALQERENLLVLLQEALEQVAPPAAEGESTFDTDCSSADVTTFTVTPEPQAEEAG